MKILFGSDSKTSYDTAVITVSDTKKLGAKADILDSTLDGFVGHVIQSTPHFKAEFGQTLTIPLPKKSAYRQVLVLGLGTPKDLDDSKARRLGGKLGVALNQANAKKVSYLFEDHSDVKPDLLLQIAEGLLRRNYHFGQYQTKKDADKRTLESINFNSDAGKELNEQFLHIEKTVAGISLVKDLVTTPPNDLYPESFAAIVEKELKPLGVKVKIFDEKKLEKMGAGALLAVGKGSARPPRLVVLEYNGLGKDSKGPSFGMVGKGITFDTGGNNIKTSMMEEMKFDMGGAASVTGAMKILASQNAKVHVVAALAMAENMVSNNAYRPSDIITSLSGQTIEVLNTDAEGRLVMCDALTYIQETYGVKKIIDIATLTGAMMVALGLEYAGVFTNNDELFETISGAAKASGEKLWRMPLDPVWAEELKNAAADMQNISKSRWAGSATAAHFLQNFIKEDVAWAHFDIAGVVWANKANDLHGAGATGYGAALLAKLAEAA